MVALISATAIVVGAEPPPSVSGAFFTDNSSLPVFGGRPLAVVGTIRSSWNFILNPDGTFTRLYLTSESDGIPADTSGARTIQGAWSYRRIDGSSALLALKGTMGFEQNYTLTFSTPTTGTYRGSNTQPFDTSFVLMPFGDRSRCANVSCRTFVRPAESAMFGFVVTGDGALVLARAVGPGLTAFGVSDGLRSPRLSVYRTGSPEPMATNAGWSSNDSSVVNTVRQVGEAVGAFPLIDGAKDSALVLSLKAGSYIAVVSSSDATEMGQALAEIYFLP